PLPHHLQTTGVGWLVAAVVLVALALVVFADGLRGLAVEVTVVEDAVVGWLAGLEVPGLVAVMGGLAALGSWMAMNVLLWGLLLALLILRRLRQLLVVLLAWILQGLMIQFLLAPLVQRPRPFGVEFRTDWTAWALPSEQMGALVVVLVGILYGLVPEGRWRQIGKWVATGLVVLIALARMYLGVEAPTDILVGVAIGVAIALLCFRLLAPSQVFPISYRRGRAAHLDVGGARGQAIRRALQDQLGLVVEEVEPFGLAGSAGFHPAADQGQRRPRQLAIRQAVRPQPPAGRSLVQARPGAAVRTAGGREAVQHRAAAGPTRGLRAPEAVPGRAAQPAALRCGRAHPGAGVPAGHRVLRRRHRARRGRSGRSSHRRWPGHHPQALAGRPGPPRNQAGQPARPRPSAAADRRRLRRGPPDPLAPGRRPGQHDALSGPPFQRPTGLRAGPATVQCRGDQRGLRGRPRAGPALPAAADAPRAGPRHTWPVPPAPAATTTPDPDPTLERAPDRAAAAGRAPGGVAGANRSGGAVQPWPKHHPAADHQPGLR